MEFLTQTLLRSFPSQKSKICSTRQKGKISWQGSDLVLAAVISDGKKPGTAKVERSFPVSTVLLLVSIIIHLTAGKSSIFV